MKLCAIVLLGMSLSYVPYYLKKAVEWTNAENKRTFFTRIVTSVVDKYLFEQMVESVDLLSESILTMIKTSVVDKRN